MAKFETLEIAGWRPALEGMRAPLKSYEKLNTKFDDNKIPVFDKESSDYQLAKRLCLAGSEHSKWMRQVQVWVKISAPLFWWSEFDTYKVATAANSESTMHTITKRLLTKEDFEHRNDEDVIPSEYMDILMDNILLKLNSFINLYNQAIHDNKSAEAKIFFMMIKELLPSSFIQTRYVNLNYAVLQNMYKQRKNHRLPQWNIDFVSWIKTLPYPEFITQEFDKE